MKPIDVLIGGQVVTAELLSERPRTVTVRLVNGDIVKRKKSRHVVTPKYKLPEGAPVEHTD